MCFLQRRLTTSFLSLMAKRAILDADMLQLSNALLNRPVMSLRTGTQVATAISPIINPNNLKIEGFYCLDSLKRNHELILVSQDIRDILPQGLVVNDYDVLVEPGDLIRLKEVISWRFELLGKPVNAVSGRRLGKVEDFATELESLYIQKIYAGQSIFKSFTGGNLGIDRNQIVEINDRKIIVQDPLQKVPAHAGALA